MLTSRKITFLALIALVCSICIDVGLAWHNTVRHRIEKNIYEEDLAVCSTDPMTGYYRNGKCSTGRTDRGTHTVCAQMTEEFLQYSKSMGNDLITPHPRWRFPGLKPGDKWCLCALRWREARDAKIGDVAPPVVLDATNKMTLRYVPETDLDSHELKNEE